MKMKSNKKALIIIGALGIIVVAGALVFFMYSKGPDHSRMSETTSIEVETDVNPDVNLADTPEEAVTQQNTDTPKHSVCQSLRTSYANIDELKKKEKIDIRFINVHKKVDGTVYRLRYFLKDSNENEIPTYLVYVYKENQSEKDILTEKSTYKKGKLYTKIEKAQGEILYSEEALNIGVEKDLFLHYENNVLKDLQGISPLPDEKDFIECRF